MALALQTGDQNEILRKKSTPVVRVDSSIKKFIKEMAKAMDKENGVGLAAPQVGKNIRLVLVRLNPGDKNEIVVPMVNPEISYFSDEKEEGEEGCLSLPGQWGQVERSKEVIVRFLNKKGDAQTLQLQDLNARIVQHEVDHLEGVLFTDKAKGVHEKGEKGEMAI